ncbi:MAG: hypothetical protein ACSHYB_10615 [Roseibacillus sp.]
MFRPLKWSLNFVFLGALYSQAVTLEEALDAEGLVWNGAGGDVPFTGIADPSGIGGNYAGATLEPGESAELSTTLAGPGVIDFWIAGGQFSDWEAFLDGEPLDISSGTWPYGFPVEGAGPHVFSMRYTSSSSTTESVSADGVIFQEEASVSLQEALDEPDLVWSSPDATKWVGVPAFFAGDGEDAAWIGGLADEEVSSLKTTVTGPAEVSFWWQTTRGSYTDGELLVDGEVFGNLSGPSQNFWKQVTFTVGAGHHEIEFRATGQTPWLESHVRGMWLDQVEVTPLEDGRLLSLGAVPEGTWLRGASGVIGEGQDDDSSLGVLLQNYEAAQLSWPLLASEQLRVISLFHKNVSSLSVSFDGVYEGVSSQSEWVETQLRVTPSEEGRLRVELANTDDLKFVQLDDLTVTELSPLPVAEALGWSETEVVADGFYGWPGTEPEAFATDYEASLSFSVLGPGRLSFEKGGESSFEISLNSLPFDSGSSSGTGSHELLIPEGDFEVVIKKTGFGSGLSISDLNFEAFTNFSYGEALGVPELVFSSSGTYYDEDAQERLDFVGETFIAFEGEVLGSSPPGANFVLETEIEGPALFSFQRRVTNGVVEKKQEEQDEKRSKITIIVIPPTVFELGTALYVNGVRTLEAETNFFFSEEYPAQEPMDSSQPSLLGDEFGSVGLTREVEVNEEGWKRFELYLSAGTHTLQWRVQKSKDGSAPLSIQLADFEVKPVQQSYHDWAANQWQADVGVDDAETWLAAWQDPMGDPDRDGFSSAYEYAFQTDPRSQLSVPPQAVFENRAVVWPTPPISSPTVGWNYWWSPHLVTWAEDGLLNEVVGGEVRSSLVQPSEKAFFRREADVTTSP